MSRPPIYLMLPLSDQIRPDWEAKLAAVRAAVTRRANRRIVMRQIGDRLVPVGVTSGRVHPIAPEEGQNDGPESGSGSSRRSRRRPHQNQEFNQIMGSMGLVGQDLEDVSGSLFSQLFEYKCSILHSLWLWRQCVSHSWITRSTYAERHKIAIGTKEQRPKVTPLAPLISPFQAARRQIYHIPTTPLHPLPPQSHRLLPHYRRTRHIAAIRSLFRLPFLSHKVPLSPSILLLHCKE
jgi:hypothetical protein